MQGRWESERGRGWRSSDGELMIYLIWLNLLFVVFCSLLLLLLLLLRTTDSIVLCAVFCVGLTYYMQ